MVMPLLTVTEGSRSTALSTLLVALGTLLSALLLAIYVNADDWIKILLATMAVLDFLVFLGAYVFLITKDRDALRSEPYALRKMAIEKSRTGDTLTGFETAVLGQATVAEIDTDTAGGSAP